MLDRDGRIVRCNRWFASLVGIESAEGRMLWEITRAPRLIDLLDRIRSSGERQSEEIAVGGRTVLCAVQGMVGRDEMILSLHDTSVLRRLEDVKRDFVVNASHELRTPLTSIRGSIEMLEGEVGGEAGRWVETIRRNADRMTAIVEDLLLLSRLEERGAEPSRETADIARIASDVVGMFGPRAQSKGLSLALSVSDPIPSVSADPFLIEQLLVNLVDNALKYTESGEVRVSCAAQEKDCATIEVSDTGIGIPEEHLSRIYERFYVVDRSRSRKLGGTGLGLAIVKHIAQSVGGTVEARSEVGKGTRFIVRLPCSVPHDAV
jgi:two-component system phosphate regulon sensor histidine kinase PhoR